MEKSKCVLCSILKCAYKWLLFIGIIGLIITGFSCIVLIAIKGGGEAPIWLEKMLSGTLLSLTLGSTLAFAYHFKQIKEAVVKELKCN